MKAMFVNQNGGIPYASAIVSGIKPIETRSRDMLRQLVGERVAVVRTHRGKAPVIVGYVDVIGKSFCAADRFCDYFDQHLVPPGSSYNVHGKGKWFYHLANAETCSPYPLPSSAIRHGRSWCEWEEA